MNSPTFSAAATDLVAKLGTTAHEVIGAYREGGERLAGTLEQRWKSALKETSPRLTPETRRNAARAQHAFSTYYAKGLNLSADGAVVVVDTLVGATVAAIGRASELARAASQKTA